jgi:hypothetical protein
MLLSSAHIAFIEIGTKLQYLYPEICIIVASLTILSAVITFILLLVAFQNWPQPRVEIVVVGLFQTKAQP